MFYRRNRIKNLEKKLARALKIKVFAKFFPFMTNAKIITTIKNFFAGCIIYMVERKIRSENVNLCLIQIIFNKGGLEAIKRE